MVKFIYTKQAEQGWLVEQAGMEEPMDISVHTDDAVNRYQRHLASLRRFKWDYPDPGKVLEEGKDFIIQYRDLAGYWYLYQHDLMKHQPDFYLEKNDTGEFTRLRAISKSQVGKMKTSDIIKQCFKEACIPEDDRHSFLFKILNDRL